MPQTVDPIIGLLSKSVTAPKVDVSVGMIYGDIGTYKTTLLCSAAEYFDPSRILLISLDRFDETLSRFPKVPALDLIGTSPNRSLWEKLRSLRTELKQKGENYDFIGFDSVSKLNHLMRIEVVKERAKENNKESTGVPTQPDYLLTQSRISEIFWEFREIAISKGFHFWYTAWERSEYLEEDDGWKGFVYYPDLPPELGRLLRHDQAFVGRATVSISKSVSFKGNSQSSTGETVPHIQFGPQRGLSTKNRVGFPDTVESPTIRKLLDGKYAKGAIHDSNESNENVEIVGVK